MVEMSVNGGFCALSYITATHCLNDPDTLVHPIERSGDGVRVGSRSNAMTKEKVKVRLLMSHPGVLSKAHSPKERVLELGQGAEGKNDPGDL